MTEHRYGPALLVLGAIAAGAFALWGQAMSSGGVFGPVGWTFVAWASFFVFLVAVILWFWLALRPLWAKDRPRVPRDTILRDYGPMHKPTNRPESPWWYGCKLDPVTDLAYSAFRVTTTEPAQSIRGVLVKFDRLAGVLAAASQESPGEMAEALVRSATYKGEPTAATIDFGDTPITRRDLVNIIVESTSRELRITRIRAAKRSRDVAWLRQKLRGQ